MKKMLPLVLAAATMRGAEPRIPNLAELKRMIARFAPTELRVDTSALPAGDRKALVKLIEASRVVNDLFLTQLWSENHALLEPLEKDKSPLGEARLHYFWINKGPWSDLDEHTAFLPGVPPKKLPGANFYPPDMTKEEFEAWVKTLPESGRREAEGFFSVIVRDSGHHLAAVPYTKAYQTDLERAAKLLREAAAATENDSLKKFLTLRAYAFLSNDYYASDVAWMDLDAPLDITIGPYETYNDELFGYKAAFEAYVNLRDEKETAKVKFFANHMQEIENNLPLDARYRNPKIGAAAPIRVVNEIFSAGDGNHGVQTAAYNLPNDERVVEQKGSKRVMLKNVQEAKFKNILVPISKRMLGPASQPYLSFDSFFTHILAHEMTHGIGPHGIKVGGRETTARQELKELYSAIEEAKADVTGLFMVQYFFDHGMLPGGAESERQLYTTFLASAFRTLRFGLKEAHGKGMAVQFNYLTDHGAFVKNAEGTYQVNFEKVKSAVRELDRELLTLEATGNYAGAKKMLDEIGILRPELAAALAKLKDIPTDIEPIFVTADALVPRAR
ncbi:MAG: MutT/NUDIX family protein [Bryobacterales bacterium]|nr:MutT/NUDIX family protein [Bryobacterales bacterium]